MGILSKKNRNGIVKKVRIKMLCACHPTCSCTCKSQDGFVAPHGQGDADLCSQINTRNTNTIEY